MPERKRLRRGLSLAAVSIALLCLAWTWTAWRRRPEALLAELVTELKARGEPVTLAEADAEIPPPEDNGAADLEPLLRSLRHPPFRTVLRGERANQLDLLGAFLSDAGAAELEEYRGPFWERAVGSLQRVATGHFPDGLGGVDAYIEALRGFDRFLAPDLSLRDLAAMRVETVAGFTVPMSAQMELAVRSRIALARIALASEAFRASHRCWPASGEELAPLLGGDVPTDPFTDRPFAREITTDDLLLLRADPWNGADTGPDGETLVEQDFEWRLPPR